MKTPKVLFIISFLVCLIAGPLLSARAAVKEIPPIKDVRVILFILDGTPKDFLYGLINNGDLPTIKDYFWDNGAHANGMTSTFPSQSASAYQSFITGLFAGRSGIPYLQWYDRATQKDIDYLGMDFVRVSDDMWNYWAIQDPATDHYKYPITIMEKLKPYPTASVYSEIRRGAKEQFPKIPLMALADDFLLERQDMLDVRAYRTVKSLFKRKHRQIPKFTIVGLYSTDVFQHAEGARTSDAKYSLVQFDHFMKEFIDILKKRSLFEKTYIVVAADHGMHDITHDVDLEPAFKKAGLNVKSGNPRQKGADVFISERGVSAAHLYFKGDFSDVGEIINADHKFKPDLDGRPKFERLRKYPIGEDKSVDIIELLRGNEGLSLVVARDGHEKVQVYSKECHATISKVSVGRNVYYGYAPDSCDPLKYCDKEALKKYCGGVVYEEKDWLNLTWDADYPDGVVQLGQVFDDGRGGDIFVVADDKGGFYKQKDATHGSLIKEDMSVPLLIHGPDVAAGMVVGPIRTVDLFPTMLDWFGFNDDRNHDGHNIFGPRTYETPEKDRALQVVANMISFMQKRPPLRMAPNQDDVLADFKKKFGSEMQVDGLSTAIDDELGLLARKLNKLEGIFPNLHRKDLLYPLVSELIDKLRQDTSYLNDADQLYHSSIGH